MTRWNQKLSLLERLRSTNVETIYHEATVGFLGREESINHIEVATNPDGEEAAWIIEGLMNYVQHDSTCDANDLDPLDHSPCTCGLRKFANPWNRRLTERNKDHG